MMQAETFDNVNGHFPIGFSILKLHNNGKLPQQFEFDVYETSFSTTLKTNQYSKEKFQSTTKNIYNCEQKNTKTFYQIDDGNFINDWIIEYRKTQNQITNIGYVNTHHGNGVKDKRVVWFQD